MRNNKGFTLVEVLAMLVVLGVLMAVTIPNVTGILSNQKVNLIKADALKMISDAKTELSTNEDVKYPATGECIILTLDRLDKNDDINEGVSNGKYSKTKSFVMVTKVNRKYIYSVRLVQAFDSGDNPDDSGVDLYGIKYATEDEIRNDMKNQLSEFKDSDIGRISFKDVKNGDLDSADGAKTKLGSGVGTCSNSNLVGFYSATYGDMIKKTE